MSSMAYRKKFRPSLTCLYSLVFGLVLLLGAETVVAQIRTVLVSPVPGDPVASGTALRNALAGISSPSSTNRWLLKIEPGIYDVGTTSLQMRSWVDIEGSGIGVTTVRSSSITDFYKVTIYGASNAELRLLTVEASSNDQVGPIAMANSNGASPRLYRVKFSSTGAAPTVWGLRNLDSTPLIEECEINVINTGTNQSNYTYGLIFLNTVCSLPAGRSSILRTKIVASGPGINNGLALASAQFVSDIRDSRMDVIGGKTTYGIYAWPGGGCSWMGNENMQIRNTEIISGGGSSASYGIDVLPSSSINFDINGSKVWGHASPTGYGILQSGPSAVGVQWSHVLGYTQTIQAAGWLSVQSTYLQGGPATAQGWQGCMGVWDENGVFYSQACP